MDRFTYKGTNADGDRTYAAVHELHNEVLITFPAGYWKVPPQYIEFADFAFTGSVPTAVITAARITALPRTMFDAMPEVFVTVDGVEQRLFSYYPDEIQFTEAEFVGLTVEAAHALRHRKDVRWLQS